MLLLVTHCRSDPPSAWNPWPSLSPMTHPVYCSAGACSPALSCKSPYLDFQLFFVLTSEICCLCHWRPFFLIGELFQVTGDSKFIIGVYCSGGDGDVHIEVNIVIVLILSSPCGSQSASKSVASKHSSRVSSAPCDHRLTVPFGHWLPLDSGFKHGGEKAGCADAVCISNVWIKQIQCFILLQMTNCWNVGNVAEKEKDVVEITSHGEEHTGLLSLKLRNSRADDFTLSVNSSWWWDVNCYSNNTGELSINNQENTQLTVQYPGCINNVSQLHVLDYTFPCWQAWQFHAFAFPAPLHNFVHPYCLESRAMLEPGIYSCSHTSVKRMKRHCWNSRFVTVSASSFILLLRDRMFPFMK